VSGRYLFENVEDQVRRVFLSRATGGLSRRRERDRGGKRSRVVRVKSQNI